MGFMNRNRFSEKAMGVTSRIRAVPKDNNCLNLPKTEFSVKKYGIDQVHQKDTESLASQRSIKLNKNDQKLGATSKNKSPQQAMKVLKAVPTDSNPNKMKKNVKAGSNQALQKKFFRIFPEPEEAITDAMDELSFMDRLDEDSDCMWLSSGSLSSSGVCEFDHFDLFLQGQSSSISSLPGSSASDNGNESDGANLSPTSELFLLSKQLDFGVKDENAPIQLAAFSNSSRPESLSSDSDTLDDDTSPSHSSISSPTSYVDSPYGDFDKTEIWVSSLDLETEDCELIHGIEDDADIFDSDISCPFSGSMHDMELQSIDSHCLDCIDWDYKVLSLDCDWDEPLFWPYDRSLYDSIDLEEFLRPSPLKDECNSDVAGSHRTRITHLRLPDKSSSTRSVIDACQRRGVNRGTVSTPSKLSRSAKAQHQQYLSFSKRRGRSQSKQGSISG
ncbi:uncharacterized protein LOC141837220 [Curcuma longa]|uniref:uncharacterized protein LOC141837220 n=1 Tax=Curcuma longa TaxID=136217 RepID=UPI003D9E308E